MILAIDLGSTSFKAAVFDHRLRPVAGGSGLLKYEFDSQGGATLAPRSVHAALREALAEARVSEHPVRSVAITSQAQTFALLDARGRPQTPFFSWLDTRSRRACESLRKALPGFRQHCSFPEPEPGLQVCQLRRLRPPRLLSPALLPTWLLRLWTGSFATDANLAAMSGLYSLKHERWWDDALDACRLRPARLPEVLPVGTVAGLTNRGAHRSGLPAGLPVVLAGNDQTAGAFAAGIEQTGAVLLTLGTAMVACACRTAMPRARAGCVRGPYPDGRFYRLAVAAGGGSVVNWGETVLAGCATDEEFFRQAASSPPDCNGLVFEPHLDAARGAWRNVGLHHAPADFARSMLEALTAQFAATIRKTGIAPAAAPLLVAGGGSRQPFWVGLLARALDRPLRATRASPLRGAARMARALQSA